MRRFTAVSAAVLLLVLSSAALSAQEVVDVSFERGNAWSLEQLRKRLVEGPVDWRKVLGSAASRP